MKSSHLFQHTALSAVSSLLLPLFTLLVIWFLLPVSTRAAEVDCLLCHGDLAKGKVVHAAVAMGCPTCHTAIDAQEVPHKKTNKLAKGLSAEQPELCYGCHEKIKFTNKTVHPALSMGCTGCHNPHSSKNEKLLVAEPPALCFNCHDKAEFSRKNVHMPVAGGLCLTCHNPHSTGTMALLNKEPINVCLECHEAVGKRPHAISGFSSSGHPLGKKNAKDPKRPGKKFYCGSCHNPHSSDFMKLFRYKATSSMGICTNCHNF